ncbi:MAG: hypothetical protein R3F34_15090 [Planctomycetota bacterium]
MGPAALVLPILSALAIGLYATGRHRREAPPAIEPVATSASEVAVHEARWMVPTGGRVTARLSRLQSEGARQRFDREAIAARLGLGTGEPWRLEIAFEGEGGAGAHLVCDAPSIEDDDGVASASIESDASDPLVALFTPDASSVAPGSAVQFVLWGREPKDGARVVGVVFAGASRVDVPLLLESTEVDPSLVPEFVARGDE